MLKNIRQAVAAMKQCKGCKAISGWDETHYVPDMSGAKCSLGFETKLVSGNMLPVSKCPKSRSWKKFEDYKK